MCGIYSQTQPWASASRALSVFKSSLTKHCREWVFGQGKFVTVIQGVQGFAGLKKEDYGIRQKGIRKIPCADQPTTLFTGVDRKRLTLHIRSDPETGQLVPGGIEAQTEQVMEKIKAIVEDAGSSMARVVKMTVCLQDLEHFDDVNAIHARFFPEPRPIRTTVGANLRAAHLVEMDAIALMGL
jgi:2-iminobutanoate/2-iminopropanoate deaminase